MAKKDKVKDSFLAELKKIPIIQVACEKTGISRQSVYRWKQEDKDFEKEMEEALIEGEALVNDMSESQLLTLIKEKNFSAIRFWLQRRNPKFRDKLEVTNKFEKDRELTEEEEKVVQRALEMTTTKPLEALKTFNQNNHERRNEEDNRSDDTKPKSA